jgi:hypothetical protein
VSLDSAVVTLGVAYATSLFAVKMVSTIEPATLNEAQTKFSGTSKKKKKRRRRRQRTRSTRRRRRRRRTRSTRRSRGTTSKHICVPRLGRGDPGRGLHDLAPVLKMATMKDSATLNEAETKFLAREKKRREIEEDEEGEEHENKTRKTKNKKNTKHAKREKKEKNKEQPTFESLASTVVIMGVACVAASSSEINS